MPAPNRTHSSKGTEGLQKEAPDESILWFDQPESSDVSRVGGKNAGLAEVTRTLAAQGIRVPPGFATTAAMYRHYIGANGLEPKIRQQFDEYHRGARSLADTGAAIRRMITDVEFPAAIDQSIRAAYLDLGRRCGAADLAVAVRSSATAEDLAAGEFCRPAGELPERARRIRAAARMPQMLCLVVHRPRHSLPGDQRLRSSASGAAIGVQKMVCADRAGSGVMFTLDTETGFPGVVVISAAWGLGENVVQGTVNPDKYVVFKRLLDDERRSPIIEKIPRHQEEEARLWLGHRRPNAKHPHHAS